METRETLLRACSLLFLFRALASSRNAGLRQVLEGQILALMGDMVPCSGGAVLLGRDPVELRAAAAAEHLEGIAERVVKEGTVAETSSGRVAVPLHVRGALAGVIVTQFPPEETERLAEHAETLATVATLANTALEMVREVESLHTEKIALLEKLGDGGARIIGKSPAVAKLLTLVERVAQTDTSVLILGESGTGKELVATAIHRQSRRAERPFVAINCAAITETLLESELFGHEKGAFTGAVAQKRGKMEMAEGGTVFLDEIGELAGPLQAKLLRVLQQREFERVGGTKTVKLDVRLVAATNRDLAAEVRRGAFREDLYHRLNVVALHVPALRERAEDIAALANHFLERAGLRCGRGVRGISPEALGCLTEYSWPGNVRELENAIERAVVLGQTETLLPEDLPDEVLGTSPEPEGSELRASVTGSKRRSILRAWEESGGDYKLAAARLNIHPNSLLRLVRLLGLRDVLK
jgi:transcriptional regulator with GAF, ATPase, and Fis domain